jgi:ribonuclease BN (tRNA processing enzyme)
MNIIALGTGSAFTMKNYQTNFLIQENGKNLIVDCGSDIRFSLRDVGLSYLDIDSVYLSHAHQDHIGGLEYLAFTTYFDPRCKKPNLYCERNLIHSIWNYSLKGGLEGLEGVDATIDTYFNATPVEKNSSFTWEGIKFDIVQSIHVSAKYCVVDSFGLMFTYNGKRIYISTDVQFAPETSMKAYYKEADLIIHDCETAPYQSGVHAHYNMLKTLPDNIKSKMILCHYQDNVIDAFDEWNNKAKSDGFIAFAEKGKDLLNEY